MSSAESVAASRPVPWPTVCAAVCAAGVVGWLVAAMGGDADRAWRALLVNFLFFTPLAGGLVVWSAITTVTGGRWADPLQRWALAGAAFAPVSIIALVVLWLAPSHWAGWTHEEHLHQGVWLAPGFVFGRDLAALAVFWALAIVYVRRRLQGGGRGRLAGWLAFVYTIVFSLLGFDMIMALDPHWYSALFGGYYFISGLYIAVAAWAFMTSWHDIDAHRRHDLGKLVVAFSLLTTYFMYSQLLPIWYENLPHEVRFIIPRMDMDGWGRVSVGLLATVYLGPLVLLLSRRAKRSGRILGPVSALILVGMWVERWWLVTPTLGGPMTLGLVEAAATGAFAGAFAFAVHTFGSRIGTVTKETSEA
jgi:MFS family permease